MGGKDKESLGEKQKGIALRFTECVKKIQERGRGSRPWLVCQRNGGILSGKKSAFNRGKIRVVGVDKNVEEKKNQKG